MRIQDDIKLDIMYINGQPVKDEVSTTKTGEHITLFRRAHLKILHLPQCYPVFVECGLFCGLCNIISDNVISKYGECPAQYILFQCLYDSEKCIHYGDGPYAKA